MIIITRAKGELPRIFLRQHSLRCYAIKTTITAVFIGTLVFDKIFGVPFALAANLVWLWVDTDAA